MNARYTSDRVGYFGFGSLVNRKTLRTNYIDHIPARLSGWRRHWQTRPGEAERFGNGGPELVLLSIHEDPACVLDGAIVIDHASNLAAVDERESGYERVKLQPGEIELTGSYDLPQDIYVYVAHCPETPDQKQGALLQSYLDAVMQGYWLSYGNEGVARFIDTTSGFDRILVQDRMSPLYPRSVDLDDVQKEHFDQELRRAGVFFN